ncbi:hypothetical protein [Streptomyces sp. NPDC048106]|uniref:hypothetical protein n=1 Tax=Streptomyces sp. NPDC048106 TaxID=3155750 RepID=UPI0034527AD2
MTSSLFRGRPRCAKAHIRVRVTHAVVGALVGAGWLMLPLMTVTTSPPVPAAPAGPGAGPVAGSAAGPGGASTADFVLPLVAVAAAVVLAAYGYLRRVRRARTRTTPGTMPGRPSPPTLTDAERQAGIALVLADDCVRASAEELSFVREEFAGGAGGTDGFARALRGAEAELAVAFAMWRGYEQGLPEGAAARRQTLAGVVGRCAEAGRRLDAEAAALDQARGLEGPGAGAALEVAEGRFRGLAVRTVAAHGTLTALRERYASSATDSVTGSVEQAKDRLLFATACLNEARQCVDAADGDRAARNLRAGEGAIAQAEVLVSGVERLGARLREAAALVPAALTGAEAELAAARHGRSRARLATGELAARLAHADGVLAAVREELTGALPHDPLDALRRITRAVDRLDLGRSGVLGTAALLVAQATLDSADDFVTVHRGAVGPRARARLSQAARALATGTVFEADTAAREARDLAERDVRAHGTPYAGSAAAGLPGAVLGGVLLAEEPDAGPPAGFGGPATRGRRRLSAP